MKFSAPSSASGRSVGQGRTAHRWRWSHDGDKGNKGYEDVEKEDSVLVILDQFRGTPHPTTSTHVQLLSPTEDSEAREAILEPMRVRRVCGHKGFK
jgi:hypothetical protein